jgi:glycosyltransferase involved in cell wall biosynthesis
LSVDISVVLCTWNNARRLALTLQALTRCTVPAGLRWELVLVNSGATEDTAMAAQQAPRALPLVYRSANRTGLSHAKNIGVSAARGGLLIFMDDDITPSPDWILAYWESWRTRGAGHYFGGPIESEYEERCLDSAVLRVAGHSITGVDWGTAPRLLGEHERFYPANWACPRAALGEVGGFDVELGLDASLGRRRVGETFDVMDRLASVGMVPWYVPEARVRHFVPAFKTTRRFLGENAEAIGAYSARAARPHRFLLRRPRLRASCERQGATVAGVPWPFYFSTALVGLRWMVSSRGNNASAYEVYLRWRFCLGRLRGLRQLRRERKGARASALARGGAVGAGATADATSSVQPEPIEPRHAATVCVRTEATSDATHPPDEFLR